MPNSIINRPRSVSSATIQTGLKTLRLLFRMELSAMVALSALAGYLFGGGLWGHQVLLVVGGVGLLAGGCSALNQWQEQDLDITMLRTRNRPLPTGTLTPAGALLLAALTISSGALLLNALAGSLPLLLGILAVIWYNAIYTPLKRITPFAAIPGAVCGALPPLIGWTAAGGELFSQKPLILAGTLFVWQIPHTWLLLCRYRDDLRRSGLPDLFKTITTERLLKINNCWLAALFLCYLLFPLFGFIRHTTLSTLFLGGLGLLLLLMLGEQRRISRTGSVQRAFHLTNISMALLLTVLILDRFFSG